MSLTHPSVIDLSYELTNGFAARFIRYKARRLVGRAGIRLCDQEDLEQDLRLHLIQRFAKFDPRVGHWNAFVTTVISRYVLTLIANRRRCKRWHELPIVSLDGTFDGDGDLQSNYDAFIPDRHVAQDDSHDETVRRDLAIDVREAMDRLPQHSRELCERLMNDSPAEVARQMGLPRTTLCGRILSLREGFTSDS